MPTSKPPFDPNKPFEKVKPAFDPNQPFESLDQKEEDYSFDPEAAVQGLGQFASSGYIPELTAAAGALFPNPTAKLDKELEAKGFKITQPEDTYEARRDASKLKQKELAERSPWSYYGSGVVGTIMAAPAYSGALKTLGISKEIPKFKTVEGAGLLTNAKGYLGNLAQRSVQAGREGMAMGLAANPNPEVGDEGFNESGRIKNALAGGILSAAVPGAIDAATLPVKGAIGAGKWATTKAISLFGGVHPTVIKEYMANASRINKAPTVGEMKELVDDFVGKMAKDVDDNRLTVKQAEEAVKALKQDLTFQWGEDSLSAKRALDSALAGVRSVKEATAREIAEHNFVLNRALSDAKDRLNASQTQLVQGLKTKAPPTALAPEVVESVNRLHEIVSENSSKAFDTLKGVKTKVNGSDLTHAIQSHMDDMMIGGAPPIGGQAEAAFNSLAKLKAQVEQVKGKLSMTDLKKIIQSLDKDIKWKGGAGEFLDPASAQKLQIRREIDAYLKKMVPEYEKAMAPLAESTALLGEASKMFGTQVKAVSALGGVAGPKGEITRGLLRRMGSQTGSNFDEPVGEYVRSQALLKDPKALEAMRQAHPDFAEVQRLESELLSRKTPNFAKDKINEAVLNSPEFLAAKQAREKAAQFTPRGREKFLKESLAKSPEVAELEASKGLLSQAEEKLQPFTSLKPRSDGASSAQEKLKALGIGEKEDIKTMFRKLSKLTDVDFEQAMKDRRILDAFDKSDTQGSRRTMLGTVLGFMVGGVAGTGPGAAAGFAADKLGGAVTKKLLDAAIKVSESPTMQTIQSLQISPEMKQRLMIGLKQHLSTNKPTETLGGLLGEKKRGSL